MRIFTAVPLPTETKNQINEIMKGRLPVVYVNTSNLHITLNFFGELDAVQLSVVKSLLPRLVRHRKSFEVEFQSLVKFRQQIHLTTKANEELSSLQNILEKGFRQAGFYFQDRVYYPHVKLANLHMDKVMNPQRKLENFPQEKLRVLNFKADQVGLYESKLLLHHSHHYPILKTSLI